MTCRNLCLLCMLLFLPSLLAAAPADTFQRDGVTFTRVPWGTERPQPVLTEAEAKRGWVTFVPSELDGIGPLAFPTRSEIDRPMQAFASQGEIEPATFGIYTTRALGRLSLQAGQFIGPSKASLPASVVDVRAVRIWKQRTSWAARTYYEIPELLEQPSSLSLPAGALQQFWVTVRVPETALPGLYEGYVRIVADDQTALVPFRLRVLPLRLLAPANKVWGLWPDTGRWETYSEGEILREVRDWRDHGITCAMMYPLRHSTFTLVDGKLKADMSRFERYMDLYKLGGLGGPVVASCQGITGLVHKLLGQSADDYGPEFSRMLVEVVRQIDDLRKARGWPEFVYHTVDEPGGHPSTEGEAAQTLRILHEAGFRTYTTADVRFTNEVLSSFLDVRCYGIGFCAGSAEDARARRDDCEAAKATYWWYGSGCYTGQEGNMAVNRHYSGFLFDKTGADGAWAWTFQRPNQKPYDDFDGTGREPKDACITYPSPDGRPPLVPTLQWEGLREGVDDLRYVNTLRMATKDIRKLGKSAATALADRSDRELETILQGLPWIDGHVDGPKGTRVQCGPLTSAQAQVARWKVASRLLDCGEMLSGRPVQIPAPVPSSKTPPQPQIETRVSGAEQVYQPALPIGQARLLATLPVIDGKLDAAWDQAFQISDLVGQDGSRNKHRTEAWIGRDAANLYVAFKCWEDEMESLQATVKDHDGPVWSDDSVEVFLDPDCDQQTYLHLVVNSLGTRRDSRHAFRSADPAAQRRESADKVEDATWNPRWQAAAAPCPEGWCVEMAIPLSELGPSSSVWGVNLNRTRRVPAGVEYGCWSPTFRGFNVPGRFGKLLMNASALTPVAAQQSPAAWGDNRLLLTLENPGLVAEVAIRAYLAGQDAGSQASARYLLGAGTTQIEVPYELSRQGTAQVLLELVPQSRWISANDARQEPAAGRRLARSDALKLRDRVTPIAEAPLVIPVKAFLGAPLELSSPRVELLAGWPGFDLTGSLNLGRRLQRTSSLKFTVLSGGKTLQETTVKDLEGTALFMNVGTADLPAGSYSLRTELLGSQGRLAQYTVPFTIIPGPWQ